MSLLDLLGFAAGKKSIELPPLIGDLEERRSKLMVILVHDSMSVLLHSGMPSVGSEELVNKNCGPSAFPAI